MQRGMSEEQNIIEADRDEEFRTLVLSRLTENNLGQELYRPPEKFDLKVTQGDEIIAGLCAKCRGRWLYVELLWVDENNRNKGLGTKLLDKALQKGRENGCHSAFVDTYEWEAPEFYKKHGFEVTQVLNNIFGEFSRYHLSKKLT